MYADQADLKRDCMVGLQIGLHVHVVSHTFLIFLPLLSGLVWVTLRSQSSISSGPSALRLEISSSADLKYISSTTIFALCLCLAFP